MYTVVRKKELRVKEQRIISYRHWLIESDHKFIVQQVELITPSVNVFAAMKLIVFPTAACEPTYIDTSLKRSKNSCFPAPRFVSLLLINDNFMCALFINKSRAESYALRV